MVLFGSDEGLYAMDISSGRAKPVVKTEGVGSIHMMASLGGIDTIAMITGMFIILYITVQFQLFATAMLSISF